MNNKLTQLAQRLAHFAQMGSIGAETPDEADRFRRNLDELLALPAARETAVAALALSGLQEIGASDSAAWLAEELEVECTMQHRPNAAGHERACLLFALAVVLPETDSVSTLGDLEQMPDLHEVLGEACVISPCAEFGLVSRLFSYNDLFAQSYGQLKRLNHFLADQVMQGEKTLFLPEDLVLGPLDGTSCSPYADLYFLVGMAVIRDQDLEDVFPPLASDEPQNQEGGFEKEQGYHMGSAGETSTFKIVDCGLTLDGNIWEQAFCETFDGAFGTIVGSLSVLPPDGVADDLRRGLEMARELGTGRMFATALPGEDVPKWSRVSYLQESEGDAWYDVSCLCAPQVEPLDTVRWQVFNHETLEESLDKLLEFLEEAAIEPEDERHGDTGLRGSYLLH